MALYVKKLNEAIEILTANLDDKSNLLLEIEKYINQILYEKYHMKYTGILIVKMKLCQREVYRKLKLQD